MTGQIGVTGATGATGASALGEFAYVYNLDAQTVLIADPIEFSSNGPLSGVTHAPGTSGITVTSAGIYQINFSVSGTEPNQFTIFVNGSPLAGSTYGSGAGTQQNTGLVMATLAAGDVVELHNFASAAAVTLATVIGGTEANVNASMTLIRLSS